jgi:TonB family protein
MTSKKRLSVLLLLCLGLISASAEQPPSPQQLLDAAHKATDLSSLGAYVLHATIVMNPGDPKLERQGKLTIVRDHDRARVMLESDGRTEERVVSGSKEFVVPGQGTAVVLGLRKLDYNWDPGRPPQFATHETFSFGSVRRQKIQDREAWCFDRKAKFKTKLCFDAATAVLLHDGSNEKSREEYSDYTSLGASLYPQKVQILRENQAPFEVRQISITPAQFNDDAFKVPDKAIEVEGCDLEERPKPLHTPEPEFSDAARSAHAQGKVYLYVLINAEGNVAGVQPLGMDAYGLAQNAMNTVKTWRFKPAMCSGHAVATELNIEVEFSYR